MNEADAAALKKEILSSLHCALPGTVESFDAETQTAVIRPAPFLPCRPGDASSMSSRSGEASSMSFRPGEASSMSFRPERSGAEESLAIPLLRDVPVFMPVPFDVHPGDACLVIFADRDIDQWLCEGTGSGRMHSLSDGFAFVGFKRTAWLDTSPSPAVE